jgi:serine phosphatase RsbU (regulator of sigma subunit)/anti-sigma regulatory factor (Ser/Thr protein kinase)
MLRRFRWNRSPLIKDEEISKTVEVSDPEKPAAALPDIHIAPSDPFIAYCQSVNGLVEIDKLRLDSPALASLKEAGVRITVPLVSQGELIGLLNLGPRRSEQEYTGDDHRLLGSLATQAAPALRVAQLVQQQQLEASERERMAHELRVARVIQQTLLPKDIPQFPNWSIAAHWQPARAVSGDFYDFITFPDGKLALIEADVTDKGVPAALVMATTRSVIQSVTEHFSSPGKVLERANDMLCSNIPPNMFVTCLYALLDPSDGKMKYANAGHNPPYLRTSGGVVELRARGMPLGLMPDMSYEEKEIKLTPGDELVIYSDGLTEAHNPEGDMFGFPRLKELLISSEAENGLIVRLLDALAQFTGPGWEQEDDVTFVTLEWAAAPAVDITPPAEHQENLVSEDVEKSPTGELKRLTNFKLASQPGNERQATRQVVSALEHLALPTIRIERLKTAVAEATMNAMEHGNQYRADLPVEISVLQNSRELVIRIVDHGGARGIPEAHMPNLEEKLDGIQSARGWGLFLIQNMVDDMRVHTDKIYHTVELVFNLEGDGNDGR